MSIFTYGSYEKLLDKMKMINNIYSFEAITESISSGIILRHDIDFDIKKAYELSKLEEGKNVKSSYFVLTTSEIYNINSLKNRVMLRAMHNKGFEIGLHFDPLIYSSLEEEKLLIKVKNECAIIEDIIGDRVCSISLHCPSILNRYPKFVGYKNAYDIALFKDQFYISDSCKDFRGKDIFSFVEKGKNNLIQVLLHPIHFNTTETTYIDSFSNIFEKKINDLDYEMRINKKYNEEIGAGKLVYRFCEHFSQREGL
ncbi:hypothetical protein [Clostridium manihotivorum]|uniref:Polysaccharide deacetylase n=1 Tax=Clostridium manihotivorum TaxID=2320868 RepID=A0A3R5QVL8_9CLOT|nr:hypothetical protein [Clostridium manihotivorum]QAA30592.1 hypothetical protein C1I91_02320 [Clostridium manihotivorum]